MIIDKMQSIATTFSRIGISNANDRMPLHHISLTYVEPLNVWLTKINGKK
jgi:hypothetical protein